MMNRPEAVQALTAMLQHAGVSHFSADELMPYKVGAVPHPQLLQNIMETVILAERARDHFGCPIYVLSSYRPAAYNKRIGGAPKSLHILFNALDLTARDVSPSDLADFFEAQPEARYMGIGRYGTFVHIDTRGKIEGYAAPARWNGTPQPDIEEA